MSFRAVIASVSGARMRVGPKMMARFSAFIKLNFSFCVTLQRLTKSEKPCTHADKVTVSASAKSCLFLFLLFNKIQKKANIYHWKNHHNLTFRPPLPQQKSCTHHRPLLMWFCGSLLTFLSEPWGTWEFRHAAEAGDREPRGKLPASSLGLWALGNAKEHAISRSRQAQITAGTSGGGEVKAISLH